MQPGSSKGRTLWDSSGHCGSAALVGNPGDSRPSSCCHSDWCHLVRRRGTMAGGQSEDLNEWQAFPRGKGHEFCKFLKLIG